MDISFDALIKERAFGKWKFQPAILIWFLLAIRAVVIDLLHGTDKINNFLIYRYVYFHTLHQQNLYLAYPGQYSDSNHYGPLFSLIIFPFAILPAYAGCFAWCLFSAIVLLLAISQLTIRKAYIMAILLISANELQTAIHETQFNPITASLIILSLVCIEKRQPFWAAFFIVTGVLVKLYGVVGICFICFSRDRLKLVYYLVFWFLVLFCLPMLISSPQYIVQSYKDWYQALIQKNVQNTDIADADFWQDISVMGMIRRLFGLRDFSNWYVLLPASVFYFLAFFRKAQYGFISYRLAYLALILLGVVIFSTSAESSTYIIASVGLGIWFVLQPNKKAWYVIVLIVLSFLVSNFFANYIFPRVWLTQYYYHYSFKVLPYFLAWAVLAVQILRNDYREADKLLYS